MEVYQTLISGKYHQIYCEDSLLCQSINENWLVAGVFDGCSTAVDSHFTSALFVKLIQKASRELPQLMGRDKYNEINYMASQTLMEFLCSILFNGTLKLRNALRLDNIELLSTIILLVHNTQKKESFVSVSGDGLIACNGQLIEIDQNNIPDFMAYHLNLSFSEWYTKHVAHYKFDEVKDIAIATDGVSKIWNAQTQEQPKNIDPADYLLIDANGKEDHRMLANKTIELSADYGLGFYDDLAIVRLIDD